MQHVSSPSQSMGVKRFGLTAALIECGDLARAAAVHEQLKSSSVPFTEIIPAAQTVLVRFDSAAATAEFIASFRPEPTFESQRGRGDERVIDVIYDGEDLQAVAELTGLTRDQVIVAHTEQQWSVAFAGFAPGFFYLHAADNALNVPRRDTPRTAVPAGAVGLAGEFSGIYPRTSPGGWQLIGHTNAPLWNIHQDPPALLEPGATVRFRAVREHIEVSAAEERGVAEPTTPPTQPNALTVVASGPQLLMQDAGRAGLTHWGVSPSGFADPSAAREANRLVGNDPSAVALESLMGGFTVTAEADTVLSLTGARVKAIISEPEKKDRQVPAATPFALLAGQKLSVGTAEAGLRVYCAVRGGFAAPVSAQSRSYDTMSEIGPAPVKAGDKLSVFGKISPSVAYPLPRPLPLPESDTATEVRVILGPREDWFTEESLQRFCEVEWEVGADTNRIGARLKPVQTDETVLERAITTELPSEGMVAGAIQVPPSGEPVVFLADHPVTGGYPVIATVHPDDLRLVAQAAPGTLLHFTPYTPTA
ncbi:carboxyltransferase domain-containing protein [Rothia sp. LK2588]|uniref:5-oxoprolinase subunit B/C family protein n=1 Tax=Rothia sp. LK2588 TaxID=3114369 RepID=UPI0034D0006A